MPKSIIYYHRAYRKLTSSKWVLGLELIVETLPITLAILLLYPFITRQMSLITQVILSSYYPTDIIKVIEKSFLLGNVSVVTIVCGYPKALTSLINFIVSIGLITLLPRVRKAKNIAIFVVFLAVVNLISAMYFTLSLFEFPYTGTEFSEHYVKSEISMWLFIPFILGVAFVPLPGSFFAKMVLIVLTVMYSVIVGTLRYAIFLFIISKSSVIYMALLFFAFGPLSDFVYIIGIYCFYASKLAYKLKGRESVWKWVY
jgi:hypothetical protein